MRKTQIEVQRAAEERLIAGKNAAGLSVDLQLDVYDETTGDLISRFGGKWHKPSKSYTGDADRARVVRMHPGQVEAARWLEWWFGAHLDGSLAGDRMVSDALCAGGRRGGKSVFCMVAVAGYALAVPGSIVWIVVPTVGFFSEMIGYLEDLLPRDWYVTNDRSSTYTLPNGSQIVIRSGNVPRKLKQGKADFIFVNEGQAMPDASYATLSASVVDSGSLVLTAANPPDQGDPGLWVSKLAGDAQRGTNPHARYFFFNPEKNPHISIAALHALRSKYDKRTYDVQVLGKFLLPPDSVLYEWDQTENEGSAPMIDITRRFTKHFEGREYDQIVGVDVQNFPWIAGVVIKAFTNPAAPDDMDRALLWGVAEVFFEQGDEIEFARALLALPRIVGDRTLVVCDASGRWQQQERDKDLQRVEVKGGGSWELLRRGGLPHVVAPDRKSKANPNIVERVRAANAVIMNAEGERRLFIDPTSCPMTVASIREWRTNKNTGKPSRSSKAAHGGDALTYVLWRFFPRRDDRRTVVHTPVPKRFQGTERTKGF